VHYHKKSLKIGNILTKNRKCFTDSLKHLFE
jgi:hypothetical protein